MDWEDAYAIQYAIRQRKLDRGTRIAGRKMGLTSYAKMKQMGVETPVFGFLTDYGTFADGAVIGQEHVNRTGTLTLRRRTAAVSNQAGDACARGEQVL